MAKDWDDAREGLTPREWLDSDPVPLTPDVDVNDPEQWHAWIRANNEENHARFLELQARRNGAPAGPSGEGEDGAPTVRPSATTVVGVRLLNAEQRALVRAARRHGLSVSDLVRRWVRAGLDEANGRDLDDAVLSDADRDAVEAEDRARRLALADAADAIVVRIADEVRRLREVVASGG